MRTEKSLNGLWYFIESRFDNTKRTVRDWRPVHVPACWETYAPDLACYEGTAWYARRFIPPPGKKWRLRFEAVNYRCEVFLNDRTLGTHEGGYTPFELDATEAIIPGRENELRLKVSNARHEMMVPAPYHGWFNYGGIYRDVTITGYDHALIDNVHIQAEPSVIRNGQCDSAKIMVSPEISGSHTGITCNIKVFAENSPPVFEQSGLKGTDFSFKLVHPVLWSCETPHLYRLEFELVRDGGRIDRKTYYFGVRRVEFRHNGLFLNGRKIFLRGINRHDDYPTTKRTVDEDILELDFQLFKELNINALRLAHYPHDRRVVEMCDRRGILVWSEIPAYWQMKVDDERCVQCGLQMTEEMIKRDWNSPSIIFWGVYNEIPSMKPEYGIFIKAVSEKIRSLDPGRLVTAASYAISNHETMDDLGPQYLDVTGINVYPAWYQTSGVEVSGKGLDFKVKSLDLKHFQETIDRVAGRLNAPFIISEFGAEGILGYRAKDMPKYSEDYQAHATEEQFKLIKLNKSKLAGTFVWLFADFPDPSREESCFNVDYNCKGVVDYGRRKKMAFETLKNIYRKL